MQEVHVLKNVKLIDSPGIVASPSNPPVSLALRSLQVEEGKESVLEAVRTLLKQCDKTQVRVFPSQNTPTMLCCCGRSFIFFVLVASDNAPVQRLRLQKLARVFNPVCQEKRFSAEGWRAEHRAGSHSVSW